MATLVLGIAGSAIGGAVLPGLSLLGTPLSGAAIGSRSHDRRGVHRSGSAGPLAGASGQTSVPQGPRLSDLKLGTSSEGTPLPRVYGRARLPGQLIWATRFKEKRRQDGQAAAAARMSAARRGSGKNAKTDRVHLLRQRGLRPLRGADRPHRPHLGRRQEAEEGQIRVRHPSRRPRIRRTRSSPTRKAARVPPIAARPTSCSRTWRSRASATACRSSISRCSGASTASRTACAR